MGVDVRSRELDRLSAVEDICARASNDSVGVRVQLRFDSISHAGDAAARQSNSSNNHQGLVLTAKRMILPIFYHSVIQGMDS